jgi:hypothetical protein
MYDRATVALEGRYVITKRDVWSSDVFESSCVLTENLETVVPDSWLVLAETTATSSKNILFSRGRLLRTLMMIQRAINVNNVSWGSVLLSLKETVDGVQVVLFHSNTGSESANFEKSAFSTGPSVPASAGPSVPASAGPSVPAFAGPSVPASAGPSVPASAGPSVPAFAGPSVPAFASVATIGDDTFEAVDALRAVPSKCRVPVFEPQWFLESSRLLLEVNGNSSLVDADLADGGDGDGDGEIKLDASLLFETRVLSRPDVTEPEWSTGSPLRLSSGSESFVVDVEGNVNCVYPLGSLGSKWSANAIKECFEWCVSMLELNNVNIVKSGGRRLLKQGSCWCAFADAPTQCVLSIPLLSGRSFYNVESAPLRMYGNVSLYATRPVHKRVHATQPLDLKVVAPDDGRCYVPVLSEDGGVVCVLKVATPCPSDFFLVLNTFHARAVYSAAASDVFLNDETVTSINSMLDSLRVSGAILRGGSLSFVESPANMFVPENAKAESPKHVSGDAGIYGLVITRSMVDDSVEGSVVMPLTCSTMVVASDGLVREECRVNNVDASSVQHFELRPTDKIMYCTDRRTLYGELTSQLQVLANTENVSLWLQSLSHDMNPLVRAVVVRRARDIYQRSITSEDLRNRLRDESLSFRECDGFIFDILVQEGYDLNINANLPVEWNPSTFYQSGDSGFVSMLYLLQWRSTLQRMIELAVIANIDGTREILSNLLNTFRVGVMWGNITDTKKGSNPPNGVDRSQSVSDEVPPPVFSDIRLIKSTSGESQYVFFFNPSRVAMILKPYNKTDVKKVLSSDWVVNASLQTQCARNRDSVIAFFIAQSVSLMTKLLFSLIEGDRVENIRNVSSTLIGMYMGSLHDFDLRHTYKHWQRVVRELRQSIPTKKRRGFGGYDSRRRQGHGEDPVIPLPIDSFNARNTLASVDEDDFNASAQVMATAGPASTGQRVFASAGVAKPVASGYDQFQNKGGGMRNYTSECQFAENGRVEEACETGSGILARPNTPFKDDVYSREGNADLSLTWALNEREQVVHGARDRPARARPARARPARGARNRAGRGSGSGDVRGRSARPRAPRNTAPRIRAPRVRGSNESVVAHSEQSDPQVINDSPEFNNGTSLGMAAPFYSTDKLSSDCSGFAELGQVMYATDVDPHGVETIVQLQSSGFQLNEMMEKNGGGNSASQFFSGSTTSGVVNEEDVVTEEYKNDRSISEFCYSELSSLDFGFDSIMPEDIALSANEQQARVSDMNETGKDFSFYFEAS